MREEDSTMLQLSPKQLSLLLFKRTEINDFDIQRNLPHKDNTDTAVKFQRENYRKTVNLMVMSLSNMGDYLDNDNLYMYFPHLSRMAAHVATKQLDLKTSRQKIIDTDQYLYDIKPKWMVLESILIVFLLNSIQEEHHSAYYDAGFRNWKKRLDTLDTDGYFMNLIKGTQKASRMIEQRNFLISELDAFDKYTWWLLHYGHDGLNRNSGIKGATEENGYFKSIAKLANDLVESGLMGKNQIRDLSLDKENASANQVVDSIVKEFAFEITHWYTVEDLNVIDNPEIEWDYEDLDWSEDPYPNPEMYIWNSGNSIDDVIDKGRKRAKDNYLFYHQFLKEKKLEKISDMAPNQAVESGLYKWLTATHYMKLMIAEMIIPGILDAINSDVTGDSNWSSVMGADILVPFHDYLDNLMGYGNEFE